MRDMLDSVEDYQRSLDATLNQIEHDLEQDLAHRGSGAGENLEARGLCYEPVERLQGRITKVPRFTSSHHNKHPLLATSQHLSALCPLPSLSLSRPANPSLHTHSLTTHPPDRWRQTSTRWRRSSTGRAEGPTI